MKKISMLPVAFTICVLLLAFCTTVIGAPAMTNPPGEERSLETVAPENVNETKEVTQPKTLEEAMERIAVLENELTILKKENDELKTAYDEAMSKIVSLTVNYEDAEVVKLVQKALNDKGYDCGVPDGIAGTMTIVGITSYQKDNKFELNGKIDLALLKSLDLVEDALKLYEKPEEARNAEDNAKPEETPVSTHEATASETKEDDYKPTMGEQNALRSAKSYLNFMPFSYTGLIRQLEFEDYSHEEAVYAADHCEANWFEQAVKSGRSYLSFMSFSRNGLIEQLEFEDYTHEQAEYAANQLGY